VRRSALCLLIALFSTGLACAQTLRPLPDPEPADPQLRQAPAAPAPGFGAAPPADESPQPAEAGFDPAPVSPSYQPRGGTLMGRGLPPPPAVTGPSGGGGRDAGSEPDELLVVSADLPEALQVQQAGQGLGLGVKRRSVLQGLGLVVTVFRLPEGVTPVEALTRLRAQAPELWSDLNHRYTLQGAEEAADYPARLMGWANSTADCGRGVRIGLVDGPLPERHPALAGAQLTRASFVPAGVATPPPGHALAVAAILAGHDRGLVPAAELFHADVMRLRDGRHVDTTVDRLAQALDWLALQPVDVINLSLGGPRNLVLEAAVARLLALDIAVVAAAGNQGAAAPPVYPAAQDGVIAVTAVDAEGHLYRDANRGDHIDFAAPGVDLWLPRPDGHAHVSGTSFAAPHVTAVLAAARQVQPGTDWSRHLAALAEAAKDLGAPGRDPLFGWGLVQAYTECG
jgi:subtilisin family serine protease